MRALALFAAVTLMLVALGYGDDTCRYATPSGPAGYEISGPFTLDHSRPTKGRMDLRQFLWSHWHSHRKGVAEARLRTADAGVVKALYVVLPDAQGHWGVDVELDRPLRPPSVSFHADLLVRVPLAKRDNESMWPPDKLPKNRIADSVVKKANSYRVVLVRNGNAIGDAI